MQGNADRRVIEGFGEEWARFDQSGVPGPELVRNFNAYFAIFPWDRLPPGAVGFDMGCGSGRWAALVAPRVGHLHCIDASDQALGVARRRLQGQGQGNCTFECASVDEASLPDASQDFGYCLGVLHHVPDTARGLRALVGKLKPGAPLLLYLYYALENRPLWFRALWRASNVLRTAISRLPHPLRHAASEIIAFTVYLPLARGARLLEALGVSNVDRLPLAAYRNMSLYTLRTDALDRFGTRLEQRFSRGEIAAMMQAAGLEDVRFGTEPPYWCAVGVRRAGP
jgi:SAM-dependent methyltransferase